MTARPALVPACLRRLGRRVAVACLGLALAACSTIPRDVPKPASYALAAPEATALARAFAGQRAGRETESGFHLLQSGLDAFAARVALAQNAERTLDLQYYMVRRDTTTQLLLHRVLDAAERGVRVRLLVDDLFAVGRNFDLATFATHPHVEVRVFNPFTQRGPIGLTRLLEFLGDSDRLNRRMHNKLWIADNVAAIVGGRNLGDEYFDARDSVNFTDLDVLAIGPVAGEVSRSFDDYWNSEWAVPVAAFSAAGPDPGQVERFDRRLDQSLLEFRDTAYARALRTSGFSQRLRSGELPLTLAPGSALYDRPAKERPGGPPPAHDFVARLLPLVDGARDEVLLISPYFIPSPRGVEFFAQLARRGVRVRILTNSLASTDVPAAHAGYARLRGALLDAGVELHEMRPEPRARRGSAPPGASSGASLHAKAVVVDRRHVLIGSMNMDPRSRLHNTEVGVLIDSGAAAAEVAAVFEEAVEPAHAFRVLRDPAASAANPYVWFSEEGGRRVVYDREPMTSLWRRLYAAMAAALTPEDML